MASYSQCLPSQNTSLVILAVLALSLLQSAHAWPIVDVAIWPELKDAVALSNAGGPGGICTLGSPCTIRVKDSTTINVATTLIITNSVNIVRLGLPGTTPPVLDGLSLVQIFYSSNPGVELVLKGLKIVNGKSATGGAGVYLGAGTAGTFTDVEFSGHVAPTWGGAVLAYSAKVSLDNVVFLSNKIIGTTGTSSGAALAAYKGSLTARGSRFSSNQIVTAGGTPDGIHLGVAVYLDSLAASFEKCLFEDGVSVNSRLMRGGAIYATKAEVTVHGSTFRGNKVAAVTPLTSEGGAIAAYSKSEIRSDMGTFITNAVPNGYGGALYVSGSQAILCTNKFQSNVARAGTPTDLAVAGDGTLVGSANVCMLPTSLSFGVIPIAPLSSVSFPATCSC